MSEPLANDPYRFQVKLRAWMVLAAPVRLCSRQAHRAHDSPVVIHVLRVGGPGDLNANRLALHHRNISVACQQSAELKELQGGWFPRGRFVGSAGGQESHINDGVSWLQIAPLEPIP